MPTPSDETSQDVLSIVTSTTPQDEHRCRHLVLVHLVTVALLASYRTALKIAMWHSLLAIGTLHMVRGGVLSLPGGSTLPGTDFEQLAAFLALAWGTALITAGFAAVNERELRRRKVDLEDLARLATALEEATGTTEAARALHASLVDAYGFPRVVVLMVDGDNVVAAAGGPSPRTPWRMPVARPDRIVAEAWSRRVVRLAPRLNDADAHLRSLLGPTTNVLVAPLFAEGKAIGAVVAEHGLRRGSRIERRVVTMVERFCGHAALALRNATLLERLRAVAATDGLTLVANRRSFEESLARELARSRRTNERRGRRSHHRLPGSRLGGPLRR